MAINLYHVFYKTPALRKEEMYVELEELATSLVKSGLLRIDADPRQNFTRFSIPTRNLHIVFSYRELYEKSLYPRTHKLLYDALKAKNEHSDIEKQITIEISKLKKQLEKHVDIKPELEMKIARILVQSAHPVVIQMIMLEEVQLFVSYGHNIGEVMDIVSWQQAGSNSGMQSTDGKNVAVFVSCGGNPLLFDAEKDKKPPSVIQEDLKNTMGDGKPALARMMGIAGQEIGHYSDIMHNQFGQQFSRYSANFSGTRANPKVNLARNTDLKYIQTSWKKLERIGINHLIDKEQELQFFARNPNKPMRYYFKLLWMSILKRIFIFRASKVNFSPLEDIINVNYIGLTLEGLFSDMAFNLEPKADVYSNSNKNIEEAIACIEALARVPQQVNKWGHRSTRYLWPNLYKVYYFKLIPGCISDYENISGKKFTLYPKKFRLYTWKEKLGFKVEAYKERFYLKFPIFK
jgi:hypothetical protein